MSEWYMTEKQSSCFIFVVVALFALGVGFYLWSTRPPECLESHKVMRHVSDESTYATVKNYWTGWPEKVQTGFIPAHDVEDVVCDKFAE